MTITLNISKDLESRLKKNAALRGLDLDSYIQFLLEEKAEIINSPISSEEGEVELIYKINQLGLSAKEWDQYNKLKQKRREESLSEEEHEEIIAFSDKLENLNVQRLRYLIELAKLRGTSLDEVMAYLDIEAPAYE